MNEPIYHMRSADPVGFDPEIGYEKRNYNGFIFQPHANGDGDSNSLDAGALLVAGAVVEDAAGNEIPVQCPADLYVLAAHVRPECGAITASRHKFVWLCMSDANWDFWENVKILTLDLSDMTLRLSEDRDRAFSRVLDDGYWGEQWVQPSWDREAFPPRLSEDGERLVLGIVSHAGVYGWALLEEPSGQWHAVDAALGADIPVEWDFVPEDITEQS